VKVYVLLVGLLASALFAVLFKDSLRSTIISKSLGTAAGIIEYTPKANDFLPTLAKYITGTKQEIWFTGISFYVTLPQHKDLLIKKLEEGVDVRFLVYDPKSQNLGEVARGFSQSEEALRSECDVTIQNLRNIYSEWKQRGLRGKFEVRLFSSIPKSRIYVFDRKLESGFTYFIPHVDQQNSPNLPGFLAKNIKTGIASAYFEGIERLWNASKVLEE
jgi:hypothetical protein